MVPECDELPRVFRLDRDYPRAGFEPRIIVDLEVAGARE